MPAVALLEPVRIAGPGTVRLPLLTATAGPDPTSRVLAVTPATPAAAAAETPDSRPVAVSCPAEDPADTDVPLSRDAAVSCAADPAAAALAPVTCGMDRKLPVDVPAAAAVPVSCAVAVTWPVLCPAAAVLPVNRDEAVSPPADPATPPEDPDSRGEAVSWPDVKVAAGDVPDSCGGGNVTVAADVAAALVDEGPSCDAALSAPVPAAAAGLLPDTSELARRAPELAPTAAEDPDSLLAAVSAAALPAAAALLPEPRFAGAIRLMKLDRPWPLRPCAARRSGIPDVFRLSKNAFVRDGAPAHHPASKYGLIAVTANGAASVLRLVHVMRSGLVSQLIVPPDSLIRHQRCVVEL